MFHPTPDRHGWLTHHCEACGHLVRSKTMGPVGHRCRSCAGVIRPGTPSEWIAFQERRASVPTTLVLDKADAEKKSSRPPNRHW